jgi:hypothetical protein
MNTVTVPRTQVYEGDHALLVEWLSGGETYRAGYALTDDDVAVFTGIEAVRADTHDVDDAEADDVPGGVNFLIQSLGYEIGALPDDDDEEPDHLGRGVA